MVPVTWSPSGIALWSCHECALRQVSANPDVTLDGARKWNNNKHINNKGLLPLSFESWLIQTNDLHIWLLIYIFTHLIYIWFTHMSLPSLVLGINRTRQGTVRPAGIRIIWLSGKSGHGASDLVSQLGSTIKLPWVRIVTIQYPSWYDLSRWWDLKLQQIKTYTLGHVCVWFIAFNIINC